MISNQSIMLPLCFILKPVAKWLPFLPKRKNIIESDFILVDEIT